MEIAKTKKEELLDAMKKGIGEAIEIIREIRDEFVKSAYLLRVEPTVKVFAALSEQIRDLSYLMDFINELKKGMEHVGEFTAPMELLSFWDRSPEIFKEMISAFETKDWITLSDFIQHELHPLLIEGEGGLSDLNKVLSL